ncbi:alpha-2-macroglobulin-like protein 1 isoform X2 [Ranitomeya imitator]|uniref:alpha-2-macroglobulin-like protein 1 isoform X2 n=1 Tax=Ranitomeya imitator TaxID=111125 RepID=UPI0037E8377A
MEDPIIMSRLMMIILALPLVSGQSSNLKYLVAAPAVLPYPSNQTVCVYVLSPDSDVTLDISLGASSASPVFDALISKGDGQLHCNTFQVPVPTNGAEEVATISISITSDVLNQVEEKSVLIRSMRNGMFLQTDRAIYQPGETVIIKGVDFTENLIAKNEPFTLVNIADDQGSNIKQWRNVQLNSGILELSHYLSPDIRTGDYIITATKDGSSAEVTVTVDKIVLPKFEVTLDAPDTVTILQGNFPINICGKYTYGKPVRGRTTGKICRIATWTSDDICQPIDGETDVNGCYTTEVDTENFHFKYDGYNNYLDLEAFLEEDGTGVERKAIKHIFISEVLAKVEFQESRGFSKPGLGYRGQMILTRSDGRPMPDEDIELYVNEERREEIYTSDSNGIAKFTLESTILTDDVTNLRAHYIPRQPLTDVSEKQPVYEDGYASVIPSYTRAVSQVKIRNEPFVLPCNERVNLWADYVLDASEYTRETIDFHFLIITFGSIVSSSSIRHTISPNGGLKSFFPFPVMVTPDMSPAATIIIYAGLDNGDLIADSIKIPVTSCFPNTVSLQFSEEQSLPGSTVNLHISAYPNSMCNIRAVDKSAELLKSQEESSEDAVNEFLNEWDTYGYPIQIEELQTCPVGSFPINVEAFDRPDTYSFFEEPGIKVLTNFLIRKTMDCSMPATTTAATFAQMQFRTFPWSVQFNIQAAPEEDSVIVEALEIPPEKPVRSKFPSTWLMNTVPIGPTGELDYPLTTPDTITLWSGDAFCTSSVGLGFSPRIALRTFKPYFLEMIVPYSVKQGETLVLKAIVLNFMRQCIKVQTTLYPSDDFQLEPCEGCLYDACLCSDPTFTFTWNIKPLTLGAINIIIGTEAVDTGDLCDGQTPIVPTKGQFDIVQRRLIVESHGIPVEKTRSLLLCAFESQTIPLDLPENVVLGSQSAEVTVTGDIMGKPLSNLNNLVNLPHGCGEQNMILLAPVIYAMTFLSITGQLTDEIVEQANGYMEVGYQNQLNYKLQDGSYSAFGNSDPSGSTWLTAFVALNFISAQKFIYIDDIHITEALIWLKGLQQEDGCFQNVGRIIHKELQGGVDSHISLTAFVTSTFLETKDPQYDEIIEKAKQCLESCTQPESSTYTKAQCAYTYTLMGDVEKRTQLLEQLDQVAIKKDDKTHWSTNPEIPQDDPLWSNPNSADVEITAYVVLAMVSGEDPTESDLGAAVPAVRWLHSQQNANGGYATTQDTVVSLWAISIYSYLTFVDENMPTIEVTNDNGFTENVTVNPQNPTEVLVVGLPDIPAEYTLEASGSGCAYVQITERYNILNPEPEASFTLIVNASPIQCPPHPAPSFNLEISASLSDPNNEESNMAILIVQLLSGYAPIDHNRLLANSLVKRVESSPTDVVIYMDKINATPTQLSIPMERQSEVQNLQPAVVHLKDYYETSRHIEVTYGNPCA